MDPVRLALGLFGRLPLSSSIHVFNGYTVLHSCCSWGGGWGVGVGGVSGR